MTEPSMQEPPSFCIERISFLKPYRKHEEAKVDYQLFRAGFELPTFRWPTLPPELQSPQLVLVANAPIQCEEWHSDGGAAAQAEPCSLSRADTVRLSAHFEPIFHPCDYFFESGRISAQSRVMGRAVYVG